MQSTMKTIVIDLSALRPTVAFPHLPENTKTIDEIGENEIKIDQVVIGSCTNGRIEDLEVTAEILKGKKVAKHVRCIIIPGTQSDLFGGDSQRLGRNLHRSRRSIFYTNMRSCLGRTHGHSGQRRACGFNNKP